MDKQDLLYGIAALVIILIIALVIKPMVTGQPMHTGIPVPTTVPPTIAVTTQLSVSVTRPLIPATTSVPVPTTTPVPTWNPNAAQTVGFVNPSNYGISLNQSLPQGTRFNDTSIDMNMTTFATISSANAGSGTTNIMYIPFPYWELVYTVIPSGELKPASVVLKPTQGVGTSRSGVSGSYSTAQPQFTIQVMDGDDPNRIVRTITPPGGIDLDLWTGVKKKVVADNLNS
jgi:hypothetical protein